MKRIAIASLVAAIIFFMWEFLSNAALNLHRSTQAYSPKQTEILKVLEENLTDGEYFLPTYPQGTSAADIEKYMAETAGKPYALINYHKANNVNMGYNMLRNLLVNILAMGLLTWVLLKMGNPSFQTIFLATLSVGFIAYLTTTYTTSIWYETKTIVDLLDTLVGWSAVGCWLGWYLRR